MKNKYLFILFITSILANSMSHGSHHPQPKKICNVNSPNVETDKHRVSMYSGNIHKFTISYANMMQQLLGNYIPVLKAVLTKKNTELSVVRARRTTSWCGNPVYEQQKHTYDAKTGELLRESGVEKVPLHTEQWKHEVEYKNLSKYTYRSGHFLVTSYNLNGPHIVTKDEWVKQVYDEPETNVRKLYDKFNKKK